MRERTGAAHPDVPPGAESNNLGQGLFGFCCFFFLFCCFSM